MRIIFFDLETTGFNALTDKIIEIAAICVDDNFKIVDTFNEFINPQRPIPPKITEITGIDNHMVRNARSEGLVLKDFMLWVSKQRAQAVAGHNIKSFDLKWISAKSQYYKLDNLLSSNIIDTLPFAKDLHKSGLIKNYKGVTEKGNISFTLARLAEHFELDEQTHRAIDDVRQNIVIYKKLKSLEETKDYGF